MNPGPDDEEATHEFVQELNREYAEFLSRYQRIMKVVRKPDTGPSANPTRSMPPPNTSGSEIVKDFNILSPGKTTQVKASTHTEEHIISRQDLQDEVSQLRFVNEQLQTQLKHVNEQFQTQLKHFQKRLEKLQLQIDQSD
jgi:predicted esterase YcpF (UPF0227 family)